MIEIAGDFYQKDDRGHWLRLSQDGSILGDATRRECWLLNHIEELNQALEFYKKGGDKE